MRPNLSRHQPFFPYQGAQAAELKVMADSPLGPALHKVADLYHQETRNAGCAGVGTLTRHEAED